MQDLRVTGVENGALVLKNDDGAVFRVIVDEVTQAKLRQHGVDHVASASRKLAPKEIQAHIRAGMSAEDVAAITGSSLDYVRKFEGPVLAERDYVVHSALSVAVHTAADTAQGTSTFGTVIRERLYDLSALDEHWASWKEVGGGWIVKLTFTAEEIDHDARWGFEPRKSALFPLNAEAIALSKQGDSPAPLVPRLRAVDDLERSLDQSRFDSGAFTEKELSHPGGRLEAVQNSRLGDANAVSNAAINRAPIAEEIESHQTADLLEALRRRRGEREIALFDDEDDDAHDERPRAGIVRLVDSARANFDKNESGNSVGSVRPGSTVHSGSTAHSGSFDPNVFDPSAYDAPSVNDKSRDNATEATPVANDTASGPAATHSSKKTGTTTGAQPRVAGSKKSRVSMPSWDEIVFGASGDDQ